MWALVRDLFLPLLSPLSFFSISERLWKFCSAFSVLSFAFRRAHSEQVDEAIKIFWDFTLSWYQISPSLMTCLTTPKSSSYLATQEALGRDAETKSKPGQPSKLSSHVQSPSAAVRRCRGYQQQAILKPMVTLVNRFSIISTPPPHIAAGFFGFHFTLLCSNNTPQSHPAETTLFLPFRSPLTLLDDIWRIFKFISGFVALVFIMLKELASRFQKKIWWKILIFSDIQFRLLLVSPGIVCLRHYYYYLLNEKNDNSKERRTQHWNRDWKSFRVRRVYSIFCRKQRRLCVRVSLCSWIMKLSLLCTLYGRNDWIFCMLQAVFRDLRLHNSSNK